MVDHSHNLIRCVRDRRAFVSDDRNLILLCELPVFALQRGESGFWRVLMPRLSWQHPAPSVVAVIEEPPPRPSRSARCSGLILRVIEIVRRRRDVPAGGRALRGVPSLQPHQFNSATLAGLQFRA
jgi:hypothetical protein